MKERPILMRGPLVLATLEDRKWQTRRVMKPQPSEQIYQIGDTDEWAPPDPRDRDVPDFRRAVRCPYGKVGDRLWVRETHSFVPTTAYRASTGVQQTINPTDPDEAAIYRAGWDRSDPGTRWRPSIHMPRWASRLLLEITSVRVERVQEITPRDVVAEGLYHEPGEWGPDEAYDHLIKGFAQIWNEINAKRGYSWESSPWVWVISYKRV